MQHNAENIINQRNMLMSNTLDQIIMNPLPDLIQKQSPQKKTAEEWSLTWVENIFAKTQNISEQRGPKYLCRECGDVFNTRLSMLTHSKIHLKPFCFMCGKYTENIFQMEVHMLADHPSFIRFKQKPSTKTDCDLDQNKNILPTNELTEKLSNMSEQLNNNLAKTEKQVPTKSKRNSNSSSIIKPSYSKIKRFDQITKMVTSRFGRCITVKIPYF